MSFARLPLPSIRAKLYTLVLACALPILAGYFALAHDAQLRERSHVSNDAQTVAEVLAAAVDRDIESGETAGQVLAHTAMVERGDLAAIHAVTRRMLRPDFPAQAFVLSAPDGTPLMNTRYAFGAPLPIAGNEDDIRQVAASGNTVASSLQRMDAGRQFALAVNVPIWKDGKVRYVLSVHLRPRRMTELLDSQHLPRGWIAEIYDRSLHLVTRSADGGVHPGSQMSDALTQAVAKAGSGILQPSHAGADGADGPEQAAFARTPDHNWVIVIRYPTDAARELLGHSLATTASAIAGLLAISLFLAWVLGGSIARAVQGLAGPAEQLGRGEPIELPATDIREVATVAHALRRVDAELQDYRHGLEGLVNQRTRELERSKAQLETVYAAIPVGLCFMDTELRVVIINDYLADINGRPAREHVGRRLSELLGPVGLAFESHYRRVLDSGRPLMEVEATGDAPSAPGQARHWISSYYPVFGPDQGSGRQLIGVNAVVVDVTERKSQQQRERDHQEMFRALFEASGDAHLLVAYGGNYVSANQAAATLFGFTDPAALMAESPASLSPLLQRDGRPSGELVLEHMRRTLDTGGDTFEWLHRRVDGSVFHADVLLTRVDIGGAGMIEATIRDISTRVTAEAALRATGAQLKEALLLAEQASRAKGEFLANMSHELRTPMNAIVGLARLLEEGQLGRRERDYVARMHTAARSLLGMLSDLLDFSRIEAGRVTLERIPFRIDEVLESITVISAPNAWAKDVELVYDIAPEVPALLRGDPLRLNQVLLNLVGNAVKFTERGQIVLSVGVLRHEDGHVRLAFAVRDSGIGIAPDVQARIFEVFSQADTSTVRKYGGAGLGLSISRRLVELAGGTLSVASEPGRGAEFRFEIAFPVLENADRATPVTETALRVLVADDNAHARAALARACASFGWRVEQADGGAAALECLRREAIDIAFIDSAMPGLDGLALLATMRAAGGALPRVCLLAPDPDTVRYAELAPELGLAAVLGKPFTGASLADCANRLMGGGDVIHQPGATHGAGPTVGPATGSVKSALAGSLQGLRVLLVEDNQINQEVAGYILAHAGAEVDIAANGRAAVTMLSERTDYDVVLMDLQMPVMNGFEAAAAIRAAGLTLPIVAMTANALDEDRARSLAAGMQDHLAKPIDVDALVATLSRLAGRSVAAGAVATPPASPPLHLPGIDLRSALPRFAGNVERFTELFLRFADSQAHTFAELREQLDAGERGAAGLLAHRLRGVAGNMGALDAAEAAHQLELGLRDADDGTVRLRLASLARALDAVVDAARELARTHGAAAPGSAQDPAPASTGAGDGAALHDSLAQLLHLLQNNNMKAIAEVEGIRPMLAAALGAHQAGQLAEAVATLRFDVAAQQVAQLIQAGDMETGDMQQGDME